MNCLIPRPDPQTLFNRIRDMFSVNVLGGATVIPESNEWYVVANDYAMQEQFYAIADQMWRETNPETACCENLYAMAARNGVYPKPAGFAQGYAKLTGVAGTAIPANLEINTAAGTFIAVGSVPLYLDSTGHATFRIKALVPGSASNSAGTVTTGTLATPVVGINSTVTICGGSLCGGSEPEDCEEFRRRYLNRLAYHPRATSAWLEQQMLEFPCATRVCKRAGECCHCGPDDDCGCKSCGDKMEFYVLFDGTFPCGIPPQNVVDDITDWIFGDPQGYGAGLVEIGVCGKVYTPKPLYVSIYIDIIGCPTISQKQQIEADIRDLFTTLCPSMPLKKRQIELIVAQVMGADIDTEIRMELDPPTQTGAFITACGDIEAACDYLPCLKTIEFVAPSPSEGGC